MSKIKEILDELKNKDNYIEDYGFRYKRIALDDVWYLLDYITNLQKEKERLKQVYTDEYNLRHKLSLELSIEKDKTLELSNHLSMYSSEETLLKQIDTYKSRIEKVLSIIEKQKAKMYKSRNKIAMFILMKLEKVLKGVDNE